MQEEVFGTWHHYIQRQVSDGFTNTFSARIYTANTCKIDIIDQLYQSQNGYFKTNGNLGGCSHPTSNFLVYDDLVDSIKQSTSAFSIETVTADTLILKSGSVEFVYARTQSPYAGLNAQFSIDLSFATPVPSGGVAFTLNETDTQSLIVSDTIPAGQTSYSIPVSWPQARGNFDLSTMGLFLPRISCVLRISDSNGKNLATSLALTVGELSGFRAWVEWGVE